MIGSDYDIPVMYQDLGTYSMNPYGMPVGMVGGMPGMMMPGMMGMYNTNYLGGTTMQPILCQDKLDLIAKKEKEDNNTLKKVGLGIGALLLVGFIPYFRKNIKKAGGIGKYIKNAWNSIVNSFKGNNQPKVSWWQKFKNFFKKKPTTTNP